VGSQFTLPGLGRSKHRWQLTPDKKRVWKKWLAIAQEVQLARGEYLGDLYDIGFDRPEAHAIAKDGRVYYGFFAKQFRGAVELRGLGEGDYRVRDYGNDRVLGTVHGPTARLSVRFAQHLLLEAVPLPPGS
jgi:alpha-galactosidase